MTTTTNTTAAEHSARRLAESCGASVGTTPDGVAIVWLGLGWAWKATGTQVMAMEDWGLMLTMMRHGAERRGGAAC